MRLPILVLACCALLSSCRQAAQQQSVPVDPALATLIPASTAAIAGVRLDALKKTRFFDEFIANQKFPGLDRFTAQTGLDPRRDLYELLFCAGPEQSFLLVRGKFTTGGREPRLEGMQGEGIQRFQHRGYTLVGNDRQAVGFMNSSVAIAGPTATVRSIIDARDTGTLGWPKELQDLVKTVPHDRQAWAVTRSGAYPFPTELPRDGNLGNLYRLFAAVENAVMSADLRTEADVTVRAHLRSPQDAQRMNEAVRGLIGFARLSTSDAQRDLLRVYDGIEVKTENQDVNLHARLGYEDLKKLPLMQMGR